MFFTCPQSAEIWDETDILGQLGWPEYTEFDYDEIPYLLEEYSPSNLLKVSTLWAIWTQWCKHIHDLTQHRWINMLIIPTG